MSEVKKNKHYVKRSKRPQQEYSTRAYDGKTLRWEGTYETELNIYPKDWSRRFPHLADRGRWVITEVK